MAKQYTTTEQRARRVLTCCGRAPAVLASMAPENVARLAALCDQTGKLEPDSFEAVRLILVDHYAAKKATTEDTDPLPAITGSGRVDAAGNTQLPGDYYPEGATPLPPQESFPLNSESQ